MMRRPWIFRLPRFLILGLAVTVIAALAVFLGLFEKSAVSAVVDRPLSAEEMQKLAPQGRYLAQAADCAACHTAPGGAPFAGGLAFAMPFGTLYASNISPNKETGIGAWTRADFHRAVRDGVGAHGRHLYPAMPYTSYRRLTEADVDAIYAFLMTREPIRQANRAGSFPFPYVRRFMTFWNLINLPSRTVAEDAAKSQDWHRGRYLVDALGHCGECHTPRDFTMATIPSRYLQGARIDNVDAPDITTASLARFGFDRDGLAAYMRAGLGPEGVMSFGMFDVVHNSTRHLDEADAKAMATYLIGEAASAPEPGKPSAATEAAAGRRVYVEACSGCHGLNGEGTPHVAPAVTTNVSLRLPSAHNLLVIVLDGLPARIYPHGEARQDMPGFRELLTDQEIVDLGNYLRVKWGGTSPDITPQSVADVAKRN
ncbi:cytochrome c [Mesorhizobium sp. M0189]|uniref:cytochrome c n=1 Tax=unclassified Mesorhizobium TaxID=325217 RepID=UPI003339DA80